MKISEPALSKRAPRDRTIGTLVELFERRAAERPDATAVVAPGRGPDAPELRLSYRELNRRSNRLAHRLRTLGVVPEDRVALLLERSNEMVAAILGVLKSGGAYLPLDPAAPERRLQLMIEDAVPRVLVCDRLPPATLLPDGLQWLRLDGSGDALDGESVDDPEPRAGAQNLAYVIYTSGSTGRPKGVAIEHRSAVALVRWARQVFSPEELAGVLASTSICFDLSVFELFVTLSRGGTVILAKNALELTSLKAREQVTLINTVPSAIAELVRRKGLPASVVTVNLAGEPLRRKLVEEVYGCATVQRVLNLYGPSEDTTYSTFTKVEPGATDEPSIGRPVAGSVAYVLDPQGRPVSADEAGELCMSGDGLSRGYLGQPAKTAQSFVPNPFSTRPGERLYRTGDLARWSPEGDLIFLGRLDHQVKLRGFRIELGEIETLLAAHPGVREATVVVSSDATRDPCLAAFVVPSETPLATKKLARDLRAQVPDYMVPAVFVAMDRLPLNPNGKVDRGALGRRPLPLTAVHREPPVAPRNPFEAALGKIWEEVLEVERIGVHDDFFELGGHSIAAMRIAERVQRELGRPLEGHQLTAHPTVARLAAGLGEDPARRTVPASIPRQVEGVCPLSSGQRGLWLGEQLLPGKSFYSLLWLQKIEGPLDPQRLASALQAMVERWDVLRSRVFVRDAEPVQSMGALRVTLCLVDLSALPRRERPPSMERRIEELRRRPFDLAAGPLCRFHLFRAAPEEHFLALGFHHIVMDGLSAQTFVEELSELYQGRSLAAPRIQFPDYVAWEEARLSSPEIQGSRSFWLRHLAGELPVIELPTDRPRPSIPNGAAEALTCPIGQEVRGALSAIRKEHSTTPFRVLFTAFHLLVQRLTGQTDLILGLGMGNRPHPDLVKQIGFFVNTPGLRTSLAGNPSSWELLSRVDATVDAAIEHLHFPFDEVRELLDVERAPGQLPVYSLIFNQQAVVPEHRFAGLRVTSRELPPAVVPYELMAQVVERDGETEIVWSYRPELFDRTTLRRWAAGFERLLHDMTVRPDAPLSELQMLSPGERHQLLREWGTASAGASGLLPQLVASQASQRPDAVAVVCGEERLSYAELDRQANRLAHYLQDLDVGPEVPVALLMARSLEMVVATVAVLKAGGAYVPLDPCYPAERLAWMLEDLGAPVLLTNGPARSEWAAGRARIVDLDAEASAIAACSAEAPAADLSPDSLAYVMYTSGSTGRPKGVAVPHQAVVRLVRESHFVEFGPEEVFLQLAPLSFDAATLEIWGPLLNGGRLVVAPPEALSLEELGELIEYAGVTTLWLTAGLFHEMVDEQLDRLAGVRQLLAGGDVLSPSHVGRTRAAHPGCRLVNGYGPTENTTFTCCHAVAEKEVAAGPIPIGRPIAGTSVYVFGPRFVPAAPGVAGELLTGGLGLSRGYFGRPRLTAEKLVPDPVSGEPGGRLYRTGDRVRTLADGRIEFLGRMDRQIKLRGFRIELGEVEAALMHHDGVREGVVLMREDKPGMKNLVAYVALSDETLTADDLRGALLAEIPAFMVPSFFVFLPELPKNTHGKVDRRTLPAPPETGGGEGFTAPGNAIERELAAIWRESLGIEQVGAHDNFYKLGGNSLLATRVLSRVNRTFGTAVRFGVFLAQPTVAHLARVLAEAGVPATPPEEAAPSRADERAASVGAVEPIPRQPQRELYPLSAAQRGVWLSEQLHPGNLSYNMIRLLELDGPLSRECLRKTLQVWVERWDVVRSTVTQKDGEPMLRLGFPEAILSFEDLAALSPRRRQEELERQLSLAWKAPYQLETGPLFRFHLFRLAPETHLLALGFHHLVADGLSLELIAQEILTLYEGGSLPFPRVQYQDFTAWQKGRIESGELEASRRYWLERFAGELPVCEMPYDRPRSARPSSEGGIYLLRVDRELSAALSALSSDRSTTLFRVLFAAFNVLLYRLTGTRDLIVGSPLAGRTHPDLADQVGLFVNTPGLRTELADDALFTEVLERFDTTLRGALEHQEYPFDELIEELEVERDPSRSPVFSVVFNQRPPSLEKRSGDLSLKRWSHVFDVVPYELMVLMVEEDDLELAFTYRVQLLDRTTIGRWAASFEHLLRDLVAQPSARLGVLSVLPAAARQQTLIEWNDPAAAEGRGATLVELFERRAAAIPEATALVASGPAARMSYRELDRLANRLAHRLRRLGVGPESRVALLLERSSRMVWTILGVLKAGGAYLPLDPSSPEQRLALMVDDAEPRVVVSDLPLPSALRRDGLHVLSLDGSGDPLAGESESSPAVPIHPQSLAYVIYTSGSTGRPKGVAIEHRSAVALLHWARRFFSPQELAGVLASTSYCFDLSIFELFVPLAWGGTVVLAENALELPTLKAREEVTLVNTVPSAIAELARSGALPAQVRTVNLAGEPLRRALVEEVYDCASIERVLNLYGPSEDTTYSTFTRLDRGLMAEPSIGRPVAGTQAYLLDPYARPVPAGAVGELCLGGLGLARGYLRRAALTAQRFVPDPFARRGGERLYRTGDLARFLLDGELEFLGRADHQVKVRGFRIELEEIETLLAEHPGVRETAVVVRTDNADNPRLVAYVVAAGARLSASKLAAYLGERVPAYMVPADFVPLDRLPLNPNGKIDRRALPEPETRNEPTEVFAAPRSPVEEAIAQIWTEVLGAERVGIRTRFVDLGGNSLVATRIVWRIRSLLKVALPVRSLFESPTVEQLAATVEASLRQGEMPEVPAIEPADRSLWPDGLPLSFAQQRLWFLHQLEPEGAAYNVPNVLQLDGRLDLSALKKSLAEVVRRHEVLRTRFVVRRGEPVQEVGPVDLLLPMIDLEALPARRRRSVARRILGEEAERPFDLEKSPLRLRALRLGPERHFLLLSLHHIAADGWSVGILQRELTTCYRTFVRSGTEPGLPALPVQYADYAVWERNWFSGEVLQGQLEYWRKKLEAVPALELPADRPRPLMLSFRAGLHDLSLPQELNEAVRKLTLDTGATLYITVLAAFLSLLHRITGQDDVAVGSPNANRTRGEVDLLIGFFINTLVLRGDLRGNPSFRELVTRVKDVALEAYAHQELPFDKLVEKLQPERDLARNPIFQVILALQNAPVLEMQLDGLEITQPALLPPWVRFDLECHLWEREGELGLRFFYSVDLFDATTIARVADHFTTLLQSAVENPSLRLGELPGLSRAQRHQMLLEWNDTTAIFPQTPLAHELFAAWSRETPQALAVRGEGVEWSYAELDSRAHRLSRRLRRLGVGPESRVGVVCRGCPEMMIAFLAVLKAGGAYVPIDPAYPSERIAFVLSDAEVSVLLALHKTAEQLPEFGGSLLGLEEVTTVAGIAEQDDDGASPELTGTHLAYIIYTSGSTGWPKGVGVEHRQLLHFLHWCHATYGITPRDRFAQIANPAFDGSIWELWPPLAAGASLHFPDPEVRTAAPELVRWMAAERITQSFVPTLLAEALLRESWPPATRLRRLVTGGEALVGRPTPEMPFELVNIYGPTETTVCVTTGPVAVSGHDGRLPSIGRPNANARIYVLDAGLRPVGVKVPGELWIGGRSLSRGYLGRPALTASRFVPDPFADEPGRRIYRTGDRLRYLVDGGFEFLGRVDRQVKIRGYRVELGEMEAALARHAEVREAVVLLREDVPGVRRLVAYVVPQTAEPAVGAPGEPWTRRLRNELRSELPEYMVPAAFVSLARLPLNANGKVDRSALPRPAEDGGATADRVPPGNAVERTIRAVWQEVLGLEKVGVEESFFEVGGTSLLLVQIQKRLEEALAREIKVVDLFRYPTIRALAKSLGEGEPEETVTEVSRPSGRGSSSSEIAILAMAGRFPGAADVESFWKNLCDGMESIQLSGREELEAGNVATATIEAPNFVPAFGRLEEPGMFDASFFGYSPRDAEFLDPQHRLFLECCWEALERAGYDPQRTGGDVGVFAGSRASDYLEGYLASVEQSTHSAVAILDATISNSPHALATRVSYKLNLRGPSINVQTACSTALVAIHQACRSLLAEECRMALAGAVCVHRNAFGHYFEPGGIYSSDGHCRAFDERADGTVGGLGVGAVVLKRLSDALADRDPIQAVIRGSAVNNDGSSKVGFTAPSVEGELAVIRRAHQAANVAPESIRFIEAHGTGTALGDPIEITALKQAFGPAQPQGICAVGSVKSNIGHLDAAAGMAGLIKATLALKHREIPPSLHYERPNPKLGLENSPFYVNNRRIPWPAHEGPRRAAVSAFGMGGTNTHVVLEEAPRQEASSDSRPWQLLVLSARSSTALEAATARLAESLQRQEDPALPDVAYTLQMGRRVFDHRQFVVAADVDDAVERLTGQEGEKPVYGIEASHERPVVFLFPGQGTQYAGMAGDLYDDEPSFRREIDRCVELLEPEIGLDLRSLLFPAGKEKRSASARLRETAITQPALFVVEYALARLWQSWGIEPQAMIGHSIGEYVAACLAGVFALEDALALVALRGRLMQKMEPGSMLALPLALKETEEVLAEAGPRLSVAAVNAPGLVVVGGPAEQVKALQERLAKEGRPGRELHTSHAFHSEMMEPMLEPFGERLKRVEMRPPEIPVRSNVTGDWLRTEQATDPEYWVAQARRPVRFAAGLAGLLSEPDPVFLEVGPGRTLVGFLKQQADSGRFPGIASLPHARAGGSSHAFLLGALGRLWMSGAPVDWEKFYAGEKRHRVELPTYPFERRNYWLEPPKTAAAAPGPKGEKRDPADWFYLPSWKRSLHPPRPESAADAGRWLVFSDGCGVADRVTERLAELGREVLRVDPGNGFSKTDSSRWTLDPRSEEDYVRLLDELDPAPTGIAHFWSVTRGSEARRWRRNLDELESFGFRSLLFFAQALSRRGFEDPLRWSVVSNDLHAVTGTEELVPPKALVVGPCRTIPLEYPHVDCRSIDFTWTDWEGGRREELTERLLGELLSDDDPPTARDPGERFVAYRSGNRWVQVFEPVRLPPPATASPRLRQGGVYLITGGLGGIGLEIAEHLAKSLRSKLVLTSRRSFPEAAQWTRKIEGNGDSELGHQLSKLLALQEAGAEVLVLQADVADRESMARAVAQARHRFGRIDGVVHSAGLPGGRMVRRNNLEESASVLAPKVRGTLVLEELLGDEPDFFVLCSSLASLLGGVGQVDYCAANAFQDAFAHVHPKAVAIDWDRWREVGMAVKALQGSAFLSTGEGEGASVLSHPLIDRQLATDSLKHKIYETTFEPEKHWIVGEHIIGGQTLLPGVGHLEMASAALVASGEEPVRFEISEVACYVPLLVQGAEGREVRVDLRQEAGWRFEVTARGEGTGEKAWELCASGRMRKVGDMAESRLDVEKIRARCNQRVLGADGEGVRLNHGDHWQCLRRVHIGSGEAFAELELAEAFRSEVDRYVLHPSLIDVATSFLIGDVGKGRPYVPLYFERVSVHRPLPARIFSHMRFEEKADADQSVVIFDVDVTDAEGRMLVEVRGYTLRRIDALGGRETWKKKTGVTISNDLRVADPEGDTVPAASFPTASAPAAPKAADPLATGLLSWQGVEVFRRILDREEISQIAVCTVDLSQLVAEVHASRAEELVAPSDEAPRDRHARPALKSRYEAPRNPTESKLAEIWAQLLGIDEVGVFDDFFELGGDSLVGLRLLSRVRETMNRELSPNAIFEAPTVAGLAAQLETSSPGSAPADDLTRYQEDEEELEKRVAELSASEVEAMLGQMMAEEEGNR